MKHPLILILLLILLTLGCSLLQPVLPPLPATPTVTSSPVPETATVSPTTTPLPGYVPHRIGVRVVDGVGEFYDRLTGEKFIPRGYNYVRLAPINGTTGRLWEATLSPGFYDPALAEEALQQMHADGYNVVRVYVDCCRTSNNVGSPSGGISSAYLDNVIDFLDKAKANDIFVLLVLHLTPADGGYNQYWEPYRPTFDGPNLRYLTGGGYEAKRLYDKAFIRALTKRDAPLDVIFAYDLTDDVVYEASQPPLSLKSGVISTANGKSYDMAKPEDKVQMMKENLVYWIDQQRAAILEVDSTALVTVSFPAFIATSRPTYPEAVIWKSTVDFIDLHIYLGVGFTLEDYVNQFGIDGMAEKPIIMGQFAAFRQGFPSAASAAQALQEWQGASCQYGFDGWLLWLRGSEEHTALYNGLSDGGVINETLAPINRPDPCQRNTSPGSHPGRISLTQSGE
jgi:cellulase (glycosyl hydrolase family 5)